MDEEEAGRFLAGADVLRLDPVVYFALKSSLQFGAVHSSGKGEYIEAVASFIIPTLIILIIWVLASAQPHN